MEKKIFLVAGEPSGDLHGANLARDLKELSPEVVLFGLGGKKMKEEGVELFYELADLAVVGFSEVLGHLRQLRKVFKLFLEKVELIKPKAVILIDYPGFNLRLAKEIKKKGIPIIYYISPQVWAWGKNRIKLIKKLVDRIIVIFKFEEELYRNENIPVSYVGHPLLDIVKPRLNKDEFLKKHKLTPDIPTVSLLPGSREKELKNILPIMIKAAEIIAQDTPQIQFLILKSPILEKEAILKLLTHTKASFIILENSTYEGLNSSDLAMVASGTATLESAILLKPMVVIYKVSAFSWLLLRSLVDVPYAAMVNIIAGRKIVPEFLQYQAKPKIIAGETLRFLKDPDRLEKTKSDLEKVRNKLMPSGASRRSAELILKLLN